MTCQCHAINGLRKDDQTLGHFFEPLYLQDYGACLKLDMVFWDTFKKILDSQFIVEVGQLVPFTQLVR